MAISDQAFELLCILCREPNFKEDDEICSELLIDRKMLTALLAEIRTLKIKPRVKWHQRTKAKRVTERYRQIAISEYDWKSAQDFGNQYWAWKYEGGPPIAYPSDQKTARRDRLSEDQQRAIEASILKAVDEDITRSDTVLTAIVVKETGVSISRDNLAHYRRKIGLPSSAQRMAKAGISWR